MRTSRCQYEGCGRERRYWIGYMVEGKLEWIPVCGTHDRFIGRKNLVESGWTLEDAIKFESNPEIEVHVNGHGANKDSWYAKLNSPKVSPLLYGLNQRKRQIWRSLERKT